ncbi:MAG: ion transporter [bacterium]|nr:ion transporter [bacterium]
MDQSKLIQTVKQLSLENEQQKGIIRYQKEEIQSLTDRLLSAEKQLIKSTEKQLINQECQDASLCSPGEGEGQGPKRHLLTTSLSPPGGEEAVGSLLPLLEAIEDGAPSGRRKGSRLHQLLAEAFLNKNSGSYRLVNTFLVGLILFSVISVTLESVPSVAKRWEGFFHWSELIIVGLFTIEYLINILVAEDKLGYIFGLWGLIDLIAILPSYFHLMDLRGIKMARTLRIVRFLRTIRMMRILKLAKNTTDQYQQSARQRIHTLKLDLQIYLTALFTVIIIFSTLIYYAERNTPGTPFTSIPAAMWWCVVTITTVGYGDMYPATLGGKLIAATAMIMGLALFGILMNVIGKAMMTSLFGTTELD